MEKRNKFILLVGLLLFWLFQIEAIAQPIGQAYPTIPEDWKNDLWLNTHYREMAVGDTYQIVARRVPEIIDNPIDNNITLPPFHYTVVRGNSVTVNENGLITANDLGTSIIEVKYDEIVANGITYGAVSPVNITYIAIDVIDESAVASTTISTNITNRMYDTHYFTGESTYYDLEVNYTDADSISVKCNDKLANKKGNTYSIKLQNRANILEIVAYKNSISQRKLYYVIDGRKIEMNIDNTTNPGKNFEQGDVAHISFKGITLPVYKLATIYNPQFESEWGGKFARVFFDNEQLGEIKSNVNLTQYDLADNNTIEVAFDKEDNYIFHTGRINEAWWGSPLGTEQDLTGPGNPNTNAPTEESDFSFFPNFGISVGYQGAQFDEIKLNPESESYADASNLADYQNITDQIHSGSFSFENNATNWGGGITSWYGTAVSNRTNAESPGSVGNQFNSAAGGDIDGIGNYAVIFEAMSGGMGSPNLTFTTFTNKDYTDGKPIEGIYVNNNTYAYTSMKFGDSFAKKFGGSSGNDPDFFKLTIKGLDSNNNTTGTVEYYLADYRFEDNTRDYIVQDWQWVDLSSLGVVAKLQFELHSSDVGDYGMNTPAYFCVDNVNVPRLLLINEIEDLTISYNEKNHTIDLTNVFHDPLNTDITHSVSYNSNPDLISASISGNSLTLDIPSNTTGSAEITIKAKSNKMAAETSFVVTVTNTVNITEMQNNKLSVTPNPVHQYFSINANGNLALFSVNGIKLIEINNYTQGQNVDIANIAAGIYFVRINNQTIKLIKK